MVSFPISFARSAVSVTKSCRIFTIEGLVPVALSLVIWKLLPDSPETARFLTKHEKEFIINRLALETGSGHGRVTNTDKIRFHHVVAAFKEKRIWAAWVMFWANTIGVYGFTATVPSVIEGLGYTAAKAQLLTIPIYVFAMIFTLIFAFWSDRVKQRSPFIMAGFTIAACGFIGQLAIPHTRLPGLTYGFLFPVAAGLYCPFVHIVCWIGMSSIRCKATQWHSALWRGRRCHCFAVCTLVVFGHRKQRQFADALQATT